MFPAALTEAIRTALAVAAADGELPTLPDVEFVVERPRDRAHGDWATNVALAAAKPARKPPREIAETVVRHLPDVPHLESMSVAGPGFVNFTLARSWLHEVLRAAAGGPDHGRLDAGGGRRVLVEFVSVNPNGPMHIGHARGAVLGDAICNLLDFAGYSTSREYYFNDAGDRMEKYYASLEARYLQALGRDAAVPEDGYHGDYAAEWGAELAAEVGDAYVDDREKLRAWALERAIRDIKATLARTGVEFDTWFSEQTLHERGDVEAALARLREGGHTYEADGALWFRTTDFGDDLDRVLVKSDGTTTYIAPDVAYHHDKFRRGYDLLINVWGPDHHGYQARMKAALAAQGYDSERIELIIMQNVAVERAGTAVRMSTRSGDLITLDEVIDEVGVDATRYHLLSVSPDTAITFDLELAKRQSMDNPVYYLQYAHARMRSLERYAADEGVARQPLSEVDLTVLEHPAELELLRQADRLREEVAEAADRRAPHRLSAYGYEVAGAFHKFYADCRIVTDDPALTQARLWLVEAAKSVLLAVLRILGITAPETM